MEGGTLNDFGAVPAGKYLLNDSFYDKGDGTSSEHSSVHDFGSMAGHYADIETHSEVDDGDEHNLKQFRKIEPPPPMRHNAMVTLEILDKIRDNIRVFAPSESLAALASESSAAAAAAAAVAPAGPGAKRPLTRRCKSLATLISMEQADMEEYSLEGISASVHDAPPIAQIDVVISGGGLKGFFACGAARVLQQELDANNITIARFAGTSAGAWASYFMLLRISTSFWMETYFQCQEAPDDTLHEVYIRLVGSSSFPACV